MGRVICSDKFLPTNFDLQTLQEIKEGNEAVEQTQARLST